MSYAKPRGLIIHSFKYLDHCFKKRSMSHKIYHWRQSQMQIVRIYPAKLVLDCELQSTLVDVIENGKAATDTLVKAELVCCE